VSLREIETMELDGDMTLHVVEIVETDVGVTYSYEIRCERCDSVDIFEQRSAALVYGSQHQCEDLAR
jgi:hypothetical protein